FHVTGVQTCALPILKEAVDRARRGEGPTLVEAKTYRWYGHYIGDPGAYRTQEEVEEWKARDPIPRFANAMLERGLLTQEDLDREIGRASCREGECGR